MMSGVGYHLQLAKEGAAGHIILVVEDEVLVRMVIADQLRNAGYTVIEAADAQQALDTLAHGFDVKLVMSDIQMRLDGWYRIGARGPSRASGDQDRPNHGSRRKSRWS
jgi:PleD family two-component response regulator